MTETTAPPIDASGDDGSEGERELGKMSFLEHLEELRKRLVISLLSILGAFLLCWNYANRIYAWVALPLMQFLPKGSKLVYTRLTEPFMLYMKVAFIAGIFLASPIIMFQLWQFISPGLYKRERHGQRRLVDHVRRGSDDRGDDERQHDGVQIGRAHV